MKSKNLYDAVNEREVEMWLDSENVPLDEALTLIKPKTHLQWHPVSKFVNNSRNDGPEVGLCVVFNFAYIFARVAG